MNKHNQSHWSQFWQQGHITTFGGALNNNYEGAIHGFWLSRFGDIPSPARLLDIATGNGAIALLAASFARQHEQIWRIDACDLAQVNPKQISNSGICLHSGVACEDLPFDNGTFDSISSQYGFEYSDRAQSLAEILRVLKTGGTFSAVCHHQDSYTLKESRVELAIYEQALFKDDIFSSVIDYLRAKSINSDNAAALQKKVNTSVSQLRRAYKGHPCCDQIVTALGEILRGSAQTPQAEVISMLETAKDEFTGAAERLRDLSRAALSEEGVQALAEQCRKIGFSTAKADTLLHASGDIAGYTIVARH